MLRPEQLEILSPRKPTAHFLRLLDDPSVDVPERRELLWVDVSLMPQDCNKSTSLACLRKNGLDSAPCRFFRPCPTNHGRITNNKWHHENVKTWGVEGNVFAFRETYIEDMAKTRVESESDAPLESPGSRDVKVKVVLSDCMNGFAQSLFESSFLCSQQRCITI